MANGAMTLLETSKHGPMTDVRQAIVETFDATSPIIQRLPLIPVEGGAYKYTREVALPTPAFRAINENRTATHGEVKPFTEPLAIFGGRLEIDDVLVKTQGADVAGRQLRMHTKALALDYTRTFFKGDSVSNPKEFDGLQKRLGAQDPNQVISNNAGTGGALSLANLRILLDAVEGESVLLMNKTMRRRLSDAVETGIVKGSITRDTDEFGRRVTLFDDTEIVVIEKDSANAEILAFNEAAEGGGSSSTSIYCVNFDEDYCAGLQHSSGIDEKAVEQDNGIVTAWNIDWLVSIVNHHPESSGRLYGITDAAVVA